MSPFLVNTPATAVRPCRRIALLKPAAAVDERTTHAFQLLESILWACQGTTRSTWQVGPLDSADVVVVHQSDRDETAPAWSGLGKPIIEIASDSHSPATNASVLVYPFRAVQVLALLDRLDARLTSSEQPAEAAPSDTRGLRPKGADIWEFVETLRTLRSVQNSEAWLVGRDLRIPVIWLRGDALAYAADHLAIQAIRDGSLNPNALTLQKGSEPSGGPILRSGMELSWFAGYYASEQLAPALKVGARYRIGRWPNFGLIRPLPSQLRIAAILASNAASVSELTVQADVSAEEVTRTLNALHACDVLVSQQPDGPAEPARKRSAPEPRGGLVKFLSNLRKHLGIGARKS